MFCDYTVDIYNRAPSTKVNSVTKQGDLTFVKNIDCDMQPYSTELLQKSYGYDIPVTKHFYIDDIENIKIGTVLQYKNDKHEVKKIIPWNNYYEVFTLEV